MAGLGSSELRVVGPTFEFRDFATGNEGRGPVGGAIEGREGRGSEFVDMATLVVGVQCWQDSRGAGDYCRLDTAARMPVALVVGCKRLYLMRGRLWVSQPAGQSLDAGASAGRRAVAVGTVYRS